MMANSRIVNLIKTARIFSSLDDRMLNSLAEIVRLKRYAAKELIFNDGDPCRGFYLVAEGTVKLYKLSADGREHVIHLVQAGGTFAEASLFLDDAYPAYAEAVRPTLLALFPREPFIELIQRSPEISLRLMGGMAVWLKKLVSQVELLALKDSAQRLAQFLSEAGSGCSIDLVFPKSVIASHLGMTPETLSRLFLRLENTGVLKVRGRNIEICDLTALQSVAQGEVDLN